MVAARGESGGAGAARRTELARRAGALTQRTAPLARFDDVDIHTQDLGALDAQLGVVAGKLRDRLRHADAGSGSELADLSLALDDVHAARFDIADFLAHERLRRLHDLNLGLAELRRIQNPDELLNRVCEAVVTSCGFDRAMLSRVEDSVWRPWKSFATANREAEHTFRQWITAVPKIALDHMLLESEMVRRMEPAIVVDGAHDPRVYRPLLAASGLKSYVAAPLMPTGRVIGLLHADYREASVVSLDRDILWSFATGFGHIFERAVLLSRLRDQRVQVRNAMQSVVSVLDELADTEIDLAAGRSPTGLPVTRLTRLPPSASSAKLEGLLTDRELEVLVLMATGATNRRIAERLVITDDTVKSHVKQVLRKLCANNRAEAISQYLHMTIARTGE